MRPSPFFSVIVPAYNRAKLLPAAIKSMLEQTFSDFELIIIDDASDDNTEEVVKSYGDERILYLRNEKNMERGASRNRGISVARGKYICFLDSDDAFLPNHLQLINDQLRSRDFPSGMLFTNKQIMNSKGEILAGGPDIPAFPWKNKFAYILRYTFNPTRACISRDVFNDFLFDPSIPGLEDIDLWLHIATRYDIFHINETSTTYFLHEGSYSLGDADRYSKELVNFKYIFSKSELKKHLPCTEKRLLLSRCHYFLAMQYFESRAGRKALKHSACAFLYYPRGYNERSNKTLFIIALYSLPLMEKIIKSLRGRNK